MSQCLRCSKPCLATAVFCDECRLLLQFRLQQGESVISATPFEELPQVAASPEREEEAHVSRQPFEHINDAHSIANARSASSSLATYASNSEQTVDKLSKAANSFAEVEQQGRRMPRPSRLAPLWDISTDIRRESTPMPATLKSANMGRQSSPTPATRKITGGGQSSNRHLPDPWPWLTDLEEKEEDSWANGTDPLALRHLPRSANTWRVGPLSLPHLRLQSTRIRIAFSVLAVLALLALAVDSVLLTALFIRTHPQSHIAASTDLPMLTISPNKASIGQMILLHMRNFSASAEVLLTHDIEEPVRTSAGSPLIQVGAGGAADISFLIDDSWGPGFHTIEAEDVTTRYTANTTLQIIGSGPTRPSHLLIDNTSLNMGADMQGANTIQSLVLRNSGDGSISWAASSNKPWLLVSPDRGMFSTRQVISVAVQRKDLKPGDYTGKLTISSNVGVPEHVQVEMSVRALPTTAGPVLIVTPAVLSFVATDGSISPASQLLTISNPGSQALEWSLSSNTPTGTGSPLPLPGSTNWLHTNATMGVVAPGAGKAIRISVDSQDLLPGTYTDTLVFTAHHGALDSPQEVSATLTVQPRCGLTISTGNLTFTAVSGQANPGSQTLGLSASASCSGTINWQAVYRGRWLTVTPASGQLEGTANTVTTVGVNTEDLRPGQYTSTITFLAGQSTQTVTIQLTIQAPPSPSAPIMGISSPNLNFSNVQGQANPPGQIVTITNNGRSPLYWHTTVNILGSSWLGAAPTGGVIAPGQSGQIRVNVDTSQLTPATYMGQIILNGTDTHGVAAAGSPQTIAVNLVVEAPCALSQPSSSSLTFGATVGTSDLAPQSVTIVATGSCNWPLSLQTSVTSPAPWLNLKLSANSITTSGQSANIHVAVSIANLAPGTYTTQVMVNAADSSNMRVLGSSQTFSVTLTIAQPCVLQVSSPPAPSSLSFTIAPRQSAPPAQNLNFGMTGECNGPTSWTATGDPGSSSWLVLSSTSGTVSSDGNTVSVSINPAGLAPGTYTVKITLSAIGSDGAALQGSPQTITVTLTVTSN